MIAVLVMSLDHNPSGESCAYVKDPKWYAIKLNGDYCTLTFDFFLFPILLLLFWIFIFGVRYLLKRFQHISFIRIIDQSIRIFIPLMILFFVIRYIVLSYVPR